MMMRLCWQRCMDGAAEGLAARRPCLSPGAETALAQGAVKAEERVVLLNTGRAEVSGSPDPAYGQSFAH